MARRVREEPVTIIPIRLPIQEVHIHADPRLAFQVITAFGASSHESGSSSKVLSSAGSRLLVEFRTPTRDIFGRRKVYRTVEWVVPHEPHSVEFETVEGPLSMMRDRLVLVPEGGCTRLRYESVIGIKGWVAGWLLGMVYVRPLLMRLMREHLATMKETIETRARRSKVFPQRPCIPVSSSNGRKSRPHLI